MRPLALGAALLLALAPPWVAGAPAGPRVAAPTVTVDPGHPSEGHDGLAIQNGTTEVHVAWAVALRLRPLLQAGGVRVVLTKSRESQRVANRERALIANRARSALFLRLHCDTGPGTGFAVYHPDRRGAAEGRTGPSQRVIAASRDAARIFHRAFAAAMAGALRDNGIRGDSATLVGRRQGALVGSIFSEVPVVLVEMCYLSNPRDAAFVKSPAGQQHLAAALRAGTLAYLATRSLRAAP